MVSRYVSSRTPDTEGKCTYWIDVNRGSVPVRIVNEYTETVSSSTYVFGDIEQVTHAGWLPRRKLHYLTGGKTTDLVVITKIDTQNRPPTSMFQLDFPDPVELGDLQRKVVYRKGKTWSLLKLPSPSSPGTERFGMGPSLLPDELPGEIEAGLPWAMISLVVTLSLVAGSIVLSRPKTKPTATWDPRFLRVPSWATDRRRPAVGANATPLGFAGSHEGEPESGMAASMGLLLSCGRVHSD